MAIRSLARTPHFTAVYTAVPALDSYINSFRLESEERSRNREKKMLRAEAGLALITAK
jgi:hypothetical protein